MPQIITYQSLKKQATDHHLIAYNGEFYTLEAFKKLCQQTKTWEYAPGTVQLYDKRNKTQTDPQTVEDPTPEKTPAPAAPGSPTNPLDAPADAPALPLPDHSTPPPGFEPGPLPVELTTPQPETAPAAPEKEPI